MHNSARFSRTDIDGWLGITDRNLKAISGAPKTKVDLALHVTDYIVLTIGIEIRLQAAQRYINNFMEVLRIARFFQRPLRSDFFESFHLIGRRENRLPAARPCEWRSQSVAAIHHCDSIGL